MWWVIGTVATIEAVALVALTIADRRDWGDGLTRTHHVDPDNPTFDFSPNVNNVGLSGERIVPLPRREDGAVGIVMVFDRGLYCPQVFCDLCGERIADADHGNVEWLPEDGNPSTLAFTHKRCCHAFEAANPGAWMAVGLDVFPIQLEANLGVDHERALAHAELMSRI